LYNRRSIMSARLGNTWRLDKLHDCES
jgi:hypothetical protein